MPKFTPLIESLPSTTPFVGPEALERRSGAAIKARIGANESVFGPAPSVIAAMRAHAHEAWMYGDPENHDLKQALAAHLNVPAENIAIGEGFGGKLVTTPYVQDREDPAALLKLAARENAKIIYFANPDNPMGTVWPAID